MIDNKGKIFGKINILDLSIVLIILLAIGLMFVKFNINPVLDNKEEITFNYTVTVKGVRNFTVNAFQENDEIFEGSTENSLGKIIKVEKVPAKKYIADTNGNMQYEEVPEQYDLSLIVECTGFKGDKGFETKTGEGIQLNKTINLFNKYCKTNFDVKEIN